jgi:Carboxypeptidase regulatory-like domain
MRIRGMLLTLLLLPALLLVWDAVLPAAELTKLNIVVKTQGGHPVDRAEIIVRWHANKAHPRARYGRAVRTTYEMRTNQDGQATVPSIPQGNILVQINAKGYQTFGKVFEITDEEKSLEITLNPPQQQYSAHQ